MVKTVNEDVLHECLHRRYRRARDRRARRLETREPRALRSVDREAAIAPKRRRNACRGKCSLSSGGSLTHPKSAMAMSRTLYSRPLTVSTVHIADAIFADVFVYVGEGEVVRKSEADRSATSPFGTRARTAVGAGKRDTCEAVSGEFSSDYFCLCEKTKNPNCSSTAPSNPRPINLVRICSWWWYRRDFARSHAVPVRFADAGAASPPRRARGLTSFPVILVFYSHVPFGRRPPLARPARSPDASLPSRLLPRRQRRAEPVEMPPHLLKLRILLALVSLPRRDVPLYHHTRGRARRPFRCRTVV